VISGGVGDIRATPDRMTGVLNDFSANAEKLVQEYDEALKAIAPR
jgi:hypothetical protein